MQSVKVVREVDCHGDKSFASPVMVHSLTQSAL